MLSNKVDMFPVDSLTETARITGEVLHVDDSAQVGRW